MLMPIVIAVTSFPTAHPAGSRRLDARLAAPRAADPR
jgi:hypothetical protein